jgi:hypothetical protein
VLELGGNCDQGIAGLLHDVIEDYGASQVRGRVCALRLAWKPGQALCSSKHVRRFIGNTVGHRCSWAIGRIAHISKLVACCEVM